MNINLLVRDLTLIGSDEKLYATPWNSLNVKKSFAGRVWTVLYSIANCFVGTKSIADNMLQKTIDKVYSTFNKCISVAEEKVQDCIDGKLSFVYINKNFSPLINFLRNKKNSFIFSNFNSTVKIQELFKKYDTAKAINDDIAHVDCNDTGLSFGVGKGLFGYGDIGWRKLAAISRTIRYYLKIGEIPKDFLTKGYFDCKCDEIKFSKVELEPLDPYKIEMILHDFTKGCIPALADAINASKIEQFNDKGDWRNLCYDVFEESLKGDNSNIKDKLAVTMGSEDGNLIEHLENFSNNIRRIKSKIVADLSKYDFGKNISVKKEVLAAMRQAYKNSGSMVVASELVFKNVAHKILALYEPPLMEEYMESIVNNIIDDLKNEVFQDAVLKKVDSGFFAKHGLYNENQNIRYVKKNVLARLELGASL